MMQYIHQKSAYNISLSDIADQAKVSKSTALNLFQRYLGISPVTYLINYRLQEAAKLLASTEKKVTVFQKTPDLTVWIIFVRLLKNIIN